MSTSQQDSLLFDIFRLEPRGRVVWLEAVADLERAHLRVRELAKSAPNEYIIVNQETGDKLFVNPNAQNGAPHWYNLRYPAWEKFYLEALQEEDPNKLSDKVLAAETAIVQRLYALGNSPEAGSDGDAERIALTQASDALLSMKNEKLNFPAWTPCPEGCS